MKKRVLSAIVMIAVFVPLLLIGGKVFTIFMCGLACLATYEFINIKESKKVPSIIKIFAYLGVIFMVLNNIDNIDFNYTIDYKFISVLIFAFLIPLVFLDDNKTYNINDALYLIKANAPINTEAHTYVQTQLASGKIKLLIDEGQAKIKLMSTKAGQNMDNDKRAEQLKPFTLTTILREQMLNLVEENEGVNIILKQSNRGIKKDKFSAFEYGLYYIKQEEDRKKKKKKRNISEMMFFS